MYIYTCVDIYVGTYINTHMCVYTDSIVFANITIQCKSYLHSPSLIFLKDDKDERRLSGVSGLNRLLKITYCLSILPSSNTTEPNFFLSECFSVNQKHFPLR